MLVPNWLQANPYRILRLSVNANLNDVHKAAAAMRRLTILGKAAPDEVDLLFMGDVPRSDIDIRAAVGRLENPGHRIADRLLWFHSSAARDTTIQADPDVIHPMPLKRAARVHDEALQGLFRAFTSPSSSIDTRLWTDALHFWHDSLLDEDYWRLTSALDRLGGFEPAASDDEFASLRGRAMSLGAEPLLMNAREAFAANDIRRVEIVLGVLGGLADTGEWTAVARQEILSPIIVRIAESCQENRKAFGTKIVRRHDAAEQNRALCDEVLENYRSQVEPALVALYEVCSPGAPEELVAREQVARCLSDIAGDFTWADRNLDADKLLREALALGEGTLATVHIERNLQENSGLAEYQRRFEGLVTSAAGGVRSLEELCDALLEEGRSAIVREPNAGEHNRPLCRSMLKRFREQVQPAFQALLLIIPEGHLAYAEAKARVAMCLNSIATDFTWADEFVIALELRREALRLGDNTRAVDRINEGIEQVSESARQETMFREMRPVKSTPSLTTFNGIGAKLYGSSDHDSATGSFATTYYFVFFFLPIFPISRYRVIQEGKSYRFLGKLPFRRFDRIRQTDAH